MLGSCLRGFANNKAADKLAHSRSLIDAFVFRFLEIIISRLAKSEISMFNVVSVNEQAGFESHFVGNPEDRFSHVDAQFLPVSHRAPVKPL